jgi:hypothetical protein
MTSRFRVRAVDAGLHRGDALHVHQAGAEPVPERVGDGREGHGVDREVDQLAAADQLTGELGDRPQGVIPPGPTRCST